MSPHCPDSPLPSHASDAGQHFDRREDLAVTTFLMITAVLEISLLCAHLGRTAVLLVLSYRALRRSPSDEPKEILAALAPVLSAVGFPEIPHPSWLRTDDGDRRSGVPGKGTQIGWITREDHSARPAGGKGGDNGIHG